MVCRLLGIALGLAAALVPAVAWAETDAKALFEAGLRRELGGTVDDARAAYGLYLQAAEAGLVDAQFNVAVMLDNGRGVEKDVSAAATWYARAAARGNKRAAFNLGQLYEAGEGVPRNLGLARAWYVASDLPAARSIASRIHKGVAGGKALSAPAPVAPRGSDLPRSGRLEFVWTSVPQSEPVQFFLEVSRLVDGKPQDLYASFVETSSVALDVPADATAIAWRVLAVGAQSRRYMPSEWTLLTRE